MTAVYKYMAGLLKALLPLSYRLELVVEDINKCTPSRTSNTPWHAVGSCQADPKRLSVS